MWCVLACAPGKCGISGDVKRGRAQEEENDLLPGVALISDATTPSDSGRVAATSVAFAEDTDQGPAPLSKRGPAMRAATGGLGFSSNPEEGADLGKREKASSAMFTSTPVTAFIGSGAPAFVHHHFGSSGPVKALDGCPGAADPLAMQIPEEDVKSFTDNPQDAVAPAETPQEGAAEPLAAPPQHEATEAAEEPAGAEPVAAEGEPQPPSAQAAAESSSGPVGERNRRPSVLDAAHTSGAMQINIDHPGDITDFYKLDKKLGEGFFACVYQASTLATGAQRAVKRIAKKQDEKNFKALRTEIKILTMVDSPHVIKVYEVFEDKSHLFIVMDLCIGGELHGVIESTGHGLAEPDACVAMYQVLRGVNYLHNHHICHRDLKANNIMVTCDMSQKSVAPVETGPRRPKKGGLFGGSSSSSSFGGTYRGKRLLDPTLEDALRICDFGTSRTFTPGKPMTEIVGTPTHVAPQVLKRSYTQACDLWSCGVILFNMLSGVLPFEGSTEEEVLQKVKTGKPKFGKEFVDHSGPSLDAVRQMLTLNQKSRASAAQALKHKWIMRIGERAADLRPEIINSLRGYRRLNKFKRASLSVMASMLPVDKIRPARLAFQILDSDGDGTVSLAELRQFMEKSKQKKTEVQETLSEVFFNDDLADSGLYSSGITMVSKSRSFSQSLSLLRRQTSYKEDANAAPFSYTEFLAATLDRGARLDQKMCRAAFNMFDKDGSGKISAQELLDGRIFGELGAEEVEQMVEELDLDRDGEVDFQEFMEALEGSNIKCFGSEMGAFVRRQSRMFTVDATKHGRGAS